jgi:GNAT superfamily N-acetyltransferase
VNVTIEDFRSEHRDAFKALNLAWISTHWEPEPEDYKALDAPESYILEPGGHILLALAGGDVVGTCALIAMTDGYELAKMAVSEAARGAGIGERLGRAAIERASTLGARRLFLESNTVLEPAIRLYRKLGFVEIKGPPSPYARANIQMELRLAAGPQSAR